MKQCTKERRSFSTTHVIVHRLGPNLRCEERVMAKCSISGGRNIRRKTTRQGRPCAANSDAASRYVPFAPFTDGERGIDLLGKISTGCYRTTPQGVGEKRKDAACRKRLVIETNLGVG